MIRRPLRLGSQKIQCRVSYSFGISHCARYSGSILSSVVDHSGYEDLMEIKRMQYESVSADTGRGIHIVLLNKF